MNIFELVKTIFNRFRQIGGVEICFGSPQKINELTIIPVAKVSFGMGWGGSLANPQKITKGLDIHLVNEESKLDSTQTEEKPIESDFGRKNSVSGGGGGGMKSQPLGIFVINQQAKIRFVPIVSITEIGLGLLGMFFLLWRVLTKQNKSGR